MANTPTRDELLKLAKEAGFKVFGQRIVAADGGSSGEAATSLERFYALLCTHHAQAEPQPEPLHITHGPLMRHAAALLRLRKPVTPDFECVAAELESAVDGRPTPAGEPSQEWLEAAKQAEKNHSPAGAPDAPAAAPVSEQTKEPK